MVTASTTERLALKGAGFVTSDEVTAAIREGVAAELVDAMMVALGSRFECLSGKDVCTHTELYTAAPGAVTTTAGRCGAGMPVYSHQAIAVQTTLAGRGRW